MTSTQKEITELIKRISGQANILAVPRIYIDIMDGDINSAIILSQLVYWSDKGGRQDGWIYKSFREWTDETSLSQYQVTRCADKLKKLLLIETAVRLANAAPTTHYRVNIETLTNTIIKFLNNGLSRNLTMDYEETSQSDYQVSSQSDYKETSQSLTETTQRLPEIKAETTTKTETLLVVENAFFVYESEMFGNLTPTIKDELGDLIDDYSEVDVIDALKAASLANKKNLRYVRGILKNWDKNGKNSKKGTDTSDFWSNGNGNGKRDAYGLCAVCHVSPCVCEVEAEATA